jgi:hypothetical protein
MRVSFLVVVMVLWSAGYPADVAAQELLHCKAHNGAAVCDAAPAKKVQDIRTKQQIKESNQSNRKISKQANAMEKARLKDEAKVLAQFKRDEAKLAKAKAKEEKAKVAAQKAETKKEAERAAKAYKPKVFVAKVPKSGQ